jgi:hypothetical protein
MCKGEMLYWYVNFDSHLNIYNVKQSDELMFIDEKIVIGVYLWLEF